MDTVLIVVAALSLAMAIGMAIVLAKLLHDEHARSEARVAALTAMAASAPVRSPRGTAEPGMRGPVSELMASGPAAPARPLRVTSSPATTRPVPLDDLEIRPAIAVTTRSPELFAERDRPSPWRPRLAVIATLVAGLALAGLAMTSARSRQSATSPATTSAAAENPPLELVSLRHAQQSQDLTITGLVRNPPGAAPISRVVATAFVFAGDGTFLASSRAPLELATIAPGDESPFVVTVPVTGDVARYRVGFRTEDGRVIAHVDKRIPDALASSAPR